MLWRVNLINVVSLLVTQIINDPGMRLGQMWLTDLSRSWFVPLPESYLCQGSGGTILDEDQEDHKLAGPKSTDTLLM